MEQRRTKILAIAFGVLVLLWQGIPIVNETLFGPLNEREEALAAVNERIRDREVDEHRAMTARGKLNVWRQQSLPSDALNAQRLYQSWLTDLAILCGFADLDIKPDRRVTNGNVYTGVQVSLEASATLEELARFLHEFHRTDLLHRVVSLSIEGEQHQGNPPLQIQLMAEGIALQSAANRETLFPETPVRQDLPADATVLQVRDATGFPLRVPFRIRIGEEFLSVTEINDESWTVARGIDGTQPASHTSGTTAEWAPIQPETSVDSATDHRAGLIAAHPFVLPVEYSPRLNTVSNQTVSRGGNLSFSVEPTGYNPALGKPVFALGDDARPEMAIDDAGRFSWSPPDDLPAATYPVTITVQQPGHPESLRSQTVQITLRDVNQPPVIASIEDQTLYAGSELRVEVPASDPDSSNIPKLELIGEAPPGTGIDPGTGEFRWQPPENLEPGEYEITLRATDGGSPPMSATRSFKVTVRDDVARFTYLVAAVQQDGIWQAWLYDRSQNRRLVVQEGSLFEIADIVGFVRSIQRDFIRVQIGDTLWRLPIGKHLRSLDSPVPADLPAASTPAPEDESDPESAARRDES